MPKKPASGSIDDLITAFQDFKGTRAPARRCLACNSPNRDLIDALFGRGASRPDVRMFLSQKLGESISDTTLTRHRLEHMGD